MKVRELIERLQEQDPQDEVEIFADCAPSLDIIDVYPDISGIVVIETQED